MLFDSNVFNMINWSVDGVEPCTGMYIRTIPIAKLPSCNMQGPVLDLKLYFNQFNNADYGFGIGWELSLARIDINSDGSRWLVLSDGRRYKILDESNPDQVKLQYQRTRTFKLVKISKDNYRIINKNGTVETLSNNRTTEISLPNATYISIFWSEDDKFTIIDCDARQLVSSHDDSFFQVTVKKPDCTLTFNKSVRVYSKLDNVVISPLAGATEKIYEIRYQNHNSDYLAITRFSSWIDFYQEDAITYTTLQTPASFPGSAISVMTQQSLASKTGNLVDSITTQYTYSAYNYLGDIVVPEWKTGTDNLEAYPKYKFFTKEITGSSKMRLRHYNNFYLQIADIPLLPGQTLGTARNGKSTRYVYDIRGAGIDAQVSTFNLPVRIEHQRHGISDKNTLITRSDTESYTYDDDGNMTSHTGRDGIRTTHDYYPASGESTVDAQGKTIILCPADPGGFITYLKYETRYPESSSSLPARRAAWQYKTGMNPDQILPTQRVFFTGNADTTDPAVFLLKEAYAYDDDVPDPYGTLVRVVVSKTAAGESPDSDPVLLTTTTDYTYDYLRDAEQDIIELKIDTLITGFDNTTRRTCNIHNILTGTIRSSTDANQLEKTCVYDALGRLTSTQYPWGPSPGQMATDTFEYDASNSTLTFASTTTNFKTIKKMGGKGQILTVSYLAQVSIDGKSITMNYLMEENTYNELLQLTKHIDYDGTEEKPNTIEEITEYTWTLHDEPASRNNPDLSSQIWSYDYYHNIRSTRNYPAQCELRSTYDDKGRLIKQERFNLLTLPPTPPASPVPDQTDTFTYDGFGRQTRHDSDINEAFSYDYDDFDRIREKTGSVRGTRIMEYAAHSTEKLVTKITVPAESPETKEKIMGNRAYDGLDRVISSTVNQSTSTYDYSGSAIWNKPARISYAGGRAFNYEYNATLSQPTSRRVLKDDVATSPIGTRTFSYQDNTGHLEKTASGEQLCTQNFKYDPFGNQINEKKTVTAMNFKKTVCCEHETDCTIRGRPLVIHSWINFPNSSQPGKYLHIEKKYIYEKNGDIHSVDMIINDILTSRSEFFRNSDGHIERMESYSLISKKIYWKTEKKLQYGAYGSIKSLKYTYKNAKAPGQITTILNQTLIYNKANMLTSATTQTGSALWTDTYTYDKSGFLKNWKTTGDLVFENEYMAKITSQQFNQDTSGALTHTVTTSENGTNEADYSYSDGQLTRMAYTGRNYPVSTDFQQDAEGHVIRKTDTMRDQTTTTEIFEYEGEDNHTRHEKTGSNLNATIFEYGYDAQGKAVAISSRNQNSGITEKICFHLKNEIFCEVDLLDENLYYIPCKIHHRINGETILIADLSSNVSDANFSDTTASLCFNQFNGSQIAIGNYQCEKRKMTIPASFGGARFQTVYKPYYHVQINGQNPYGFTLRIASRDVSTRGNLYSYNRTTKKMTPYTGQPPLVPKPEQSALSATQANPARTPVIGMHGERIQWIGPREQLYFLGNGARSYDPTLQCFLSQDPYSPFAGAGINSYSFCLGDPVNRTDPSGYITSTEGRILFAVAGFILTLLGLGLLGFVISAAAIALSTAVAALTLVVVGLTTALIPPVYSKLVEDPQLARLQNRDPDIEYQGATAIDMEISTDGYLPGEEPATRNHGASIPQDRLISGMTTARLLPAPPAMRSAADGAPRKFKL